MRDDRNEATSTHAGSASFWRRILAALAMLALTLMLTLFGTSVTMHGVSLMRTVISLNQSGVERVATVVRIDTTTSTSGPYDQSRIRSLPVMEFDYNDRLYVFTAQAVSGGRVFEKGEQVTVVFPEGDPDSAVLAEFGNEAWAVPMGLGVLLMLGALLSGWATWMICFARSSTARSR